MSEKITDKAYEVWFESLEELERELPGMIARKNTAHWQSSVIGNNGSGMYGGSTSWFGCTGGSKQCFQLIRDGWPELFKTLQPMIEKLRQHFALDNAAALNTEVRRRKMRRSDSGDALDITRVWSGQLDKAWSKPVKFPRQAANQRYATIYVDSATSGATDASRTIWRAAAAITMIEVLNRMGVQTEVWVGSTGADVWREYGAPRLFRSAVRVKRFDQPLNEDRMATMLSCAFYRTWGFGMYMGAPFQTCSSLGRLSPQSMPEILEERVKRGERLFKIGYCLTEDQAIDAVKAVVASIQKKEDAAA